MPFICGKDHLTILCLPTLFRARDINGCRDSSMSQAPPQKNAAFSNKSTVKNPPPSPFRARNSELWEYTFREKESHDLMDEKRLKGIEDANRRIGREEGREEGRAEGLAEGRAEIVRKMHSNGMTADQICAILKIPQQEIEKILGE